MLPVLIVVWANVIDEISRTNAANRIRDDPIRALCRAVERRGELKFSIVYLPLHRFLRFPKLRDLPGRCSSRMQFSFLHLTKLLLSKTNPSIRECLAMSQ